MAPVETQREPDAKDKSSIVLATAEPRFARSGIPSWITYWVTFFSFPLNMMGMSWSIFGYGLFMSKNVYVRSLCVSYLAWIGLDRNRCNGIGYPHHRAPFRYLRKWLRNNWLYAIQCAYYPLRIHKLAELPTTTADNKKAKYLFACHPHGVIGVGSLSVFGTEESGFNQLYPGIDTYMTGLRQIFLTPFFRDWCLFGGCFSADKKSFRHVFETIQGSVAVNLGGAAEALIGLEPNPTTGNTVMKLLLKDRKGFCKLALQHGVSLVPVITFEEHLLFDLIRFPTSGGTLLYKLQVYLQKQILGFAPLLVWGNMAPLMPKRQTLNVFVGAPIACPRIEHPSQEEIDAKHKEYCGELEKMFHGCKKLVPGCEDWELELVDHPFNSV
ncbi:acylglycerol O-acyltransferase [Seminavis robusta]|uniref:Acyltransferase n=1 Tax=Seminavis robusta TaxID=568900 RepID=A0A9N8HEL6_9STRA|nr:acylglycerol O-acyltransferase [Seminavis robusta]|eukprot:Sro391_g133200.1 acylglycerol O-acyltransferase (383) ;mRNA; f:60414-61562